MKNIYLLSILLLSSLMAHAQLLPEVTGINIFEHHFSGCSPCAPSSIGDSSAYDFVKREHINAVQPVAFDVNRDLVEHNGNSSEPAPFGFTSDTSNVWAGQFGGNGTTKYCRVTGFDYLNATQWSVLNAYDSTRAWKTIDSVQQGEVYIAKIRNLEYYVVLTITAYQTITDNDFTFNYKYTSNPIVATSLFEIEQELPLNVYPNPTANDLNIQLDRTYKNVSVSIMNQYGAQVLSSSRNAGNSVKLSLENLANGIYFVSVYADGKSSRTKLVKAE